jgi:hypothetical protein
LRLVDQREPLPAIEQTVNVDKSCKWQRRQAVSITRVRPAAGNETAPASQLRGLSTRPLAVPTTRKISPPLSWKTQVQALKAASLLSSSTMSIVALVFISNKRTQLAHLPTPAR